MKIILRNLGGIFALLFILSACKNGKEPIIQPNQPKDKLQKIMWSDGTKDEFEYNSQGFPTKRTHREKSGELEIMNFEYNAQNQLVKITKNNGIYYQVFYKDDLIEKVDEKSGNLVVNRYLYKFNAQKQLIEQITLFVLENSETFETEKATFNYYENGNLSEMNIYFKPMGLGEFTLAETVRYEMYDDKVNPSFFYYMHPFIPTITMQKNNSLIIRSLSSEAGATPLVEEYEYTYNEKGQPISVRFEVNGGIILKANGAFLYF
jgi:hypothetical protein